MGLRFRKSIKIIPGVKLNINKKSVGLTVGTRGAHYNINSKGRRTTTVGIPGTGLSYSSSSNKSKANNYTDKYSTDTSYTPGSYDNKKKKQNVWIMFFITLFLGPFGVHKFINRQYSMGIIYLLTVGLFGFGWFGDIINAFINIFTKPNKDKVESELLKWQQLFIPERNELIMSRIQLQQWTEHSILQHSRIADDCQKIIHSTTNLETFFSRYDLLMEKLSLLSELERYLPENNSMLIDCKNDYTNNKQEYIIALIDRCWEAATLKANTLKTEKGRNNQFLKLISNLSSYEKHMTSNTIEYYQTKHCSLYPNDTITDIDEVITKLPLPPTFNFNIDTTK